MITGCSSSTKASQPVLIDQCKAEPTKEVKAPDDSLMNGMENPVTYTDEQLRKGTSKAEVVDNQSANNLLWANDRNKLKGLQDYIRQLQAGGIISK